MSPPNAITITIGDIDGDTVLARITLPIGVLEILCEATFHGRSLHLTRVHIEGLGPGDLGRAGLNAVGGKALEVFDVDDLVVEGAPRSTGARVGRTPPPFRYPRRR